MILKIYFWYLIILFLFLSIISCDANIDYLKKDEDLIIMSVSVPLMKELGIRQGIIVQEEINEVKNIYYLRKFSFEFIPIAYTNVEVLYKYIVNGLLGEVRTVIIFNEGNILSVIWILEKLDKSDMLHRSSQFSWFFYLDKSLNLEPYQKLLIRYDCEFIFIYPANKTEYKLTEVYKIKNSTMTNDYGTYDYHKGLTVANLPFLKRRIDFNNSVLTLEYFSHLHTCYGPGCAQLEIIYDMERLLNLKYNKIFVPERAEKWKCNPTLKESDLIWMYLPYNSDFYFFQCDLIGPFFSLLLNWYIRYPINIPQPDYYIQPFEIDVWLAIFAFLMLGSVLLMIMLFFKTKNAADVGNFNFIDCLCVTFEIFCGQDGSDTVIFKTFIFALHFLAMFIINSYSAIISSFLAVQIPKIPFRNAEEFSKQKKYLLSSFNESGYYPRYFLSLSRDPYAMKAYKNLEKLIPVKEALEKMCSENLAMMELGDKMWSFKTKCPLYQIEQPLILTYSANPIQRHSPFTEVFNYMLIRYYAPGIHERLERVTGLQPPLDDIENFFEPVELNQMAQVLAIVPCTVIIALILLFLEIFFKNFKYLKTYTKAKFFKKKQKIKNVCN